MHPLGEPLPFIWGSKPPLQGSIGPLAPGVGAPDGGEIPGHRSQSRAQLGKLRL